MSLPAGVALRCLPLQDGQPCGDAGDALPIEGGLLLVMLDGLGHGPPAARAAQRALALLRHEPDAPLEQLMARLDAGLRDTRGVAAGLARLDDDGTLAFAGVGNIAALHWRGGRPAHLPCVPGVLGGGRAAAVMQTRVPLADGDWVLLHTDGLVGPLSLGPVLPEWRRDPGLLCAHLTARHRRADDDAGVLACHWQPAATRAGGPA